MNTAILTPKELFQKPVCYTIPTFQRPYVWNQRDQWDPLWEDVRNLAENYLEALDHFQGNSVKAEQETKKHFLGAVVLQQVPTPAKEIEQREVIDGQQRVTTLQLLLDAVQELCEDLSFRPAATLLSKLVTNDEDLIGDESHHRFKLWPTRGDRDAFTHAMDNGLAVDKFESSLIVQAHDFFQKQIHKWLESAVDREKQWIDALYTATTAMLQMVVIDLDYNDDPNVIFETLNARGTPLRQSDLIKNFVIAHYTGTSNAEEGLWGNLDDQWWRDEVRQGRLYRNRLDMLFNHWLAMRNGDEVSPSRVFTTFQANANSTSVDVLMSEARRDLGNYRRFQIKENRSPEEEMFHYRLGVMQAGVITPALLVLLAAEHDTRVRAFNVLESFLVRRMVCRKTTKDYNRLVLDLAVRLRETDPNQVDKVVVTFLKGQQADSRLWPTDTDLVDDLATSPVYSLLTRGRLRLVLEGVERQIRLRSGKFDNLSVPLGLTIEHLMPISWGSNWPIQSEIDPEEAKRHRNRIVHTIGNLTLVSGRLNSAMSNAGWDAKRGELLKHSQMSLNSELNGQGYWDEDTIHARGRRIAQLIAESWPGPNSTKWD